MYINAWRLMHIHSSVPYMNFPFRVGTIFFFEKGRGFFVSKFSSFLLANFYDKEYREAVSVKPVQ